MNRIYRLSSPKYICLEYLDIAKRIIIKNFNISIYHPYCFCRIKIYWKMWYDVYIHQFISSSIFGEITWIRSWHAPVAFWSPVGENLDFSIKRKGEWKMSQKDKNIIGDKSLRLSGCRAVSGRQCCIVLCLLSDTGRE